MRIFLGVSCAFIVWGAGCAGSISGEVDGDSVPGFSTSALGVFELEGTDAVGLFAYFASAGEACSLLAQDLEIMADEDDPEDEAKKREDLYKEGTPEEFWYALIAISADDGDDLEDEQEIDLEDFDEDIRASFTVCHRDEYPEEKDGFLEIDDECFVAEDGVLTAKYSPKDALDIGTEKEIDLNDDDGDSAGEITFSGRARYCEALSDALDDVYGQQPDPPLDGSGECTFSTDCQLLEMASQSCTDSNDCGDSEERCVEDSNGQGWCILIVEDSATCESASLGQTFFSSVEGTSVPTCVDFDTFCDGDTCSF